MGKPTTQNINFINHFSHPHPLQLTPAASSPPCFACKLAGGNNRIYSCRPCNFSLHESCSKMKQVIKHPSHPSHTLSLLVAPVYDGGYFSCDGCGIIGTGFSYQCSHCDFDIHALCAYKPLSVLHNSHPQHSLKLAFQSPYGANKGFSCDICRKIGKNQWLYRCIPCEFDAHVGCITPPQPHFLQHSASAPHPHVHQNPLPMPNQGNNMPITRPMRRPNMSLTRPNRHIVQNNMTYGPRIQNNNLGYNGAIGPTAATGQEGQSFGQESIDGSGYDGSTLTGEFDGEVDIEVEYEVDVYEGDNNGEANVYEENNKGKRLDNVGYGDDDGSSSSESDFGGSSDTRSQGSDKTHPLSVRTKQRTDVGRKKIVSPSGSIARSSCSSARSKSSSRGGLQGSKTPIQGPRRVLNRSNNAVSAGGPYRFDGPRDPQIQFSEPQELNGPSVGPSNAIDSGANHGNNYNEVSRSDLYGGEDNGSYYVSYGDGGCDFEAGVGFAEYGYDDQGCNETYGGNDFESYSDFAGGIESMYEGDEFYNGNVDGLQYGGLNDEPNNQYVSTVGPVGGPAGGSGMSYQNQYAQTGRPRNIGRYGGGRGNPNMNQGPYNTQPRVMGRRVQYGPNGGANRMNGGLNAPNGLGNTVVNTMVQSLCQGLAMNMLGGAGGGGGDVNGGGGDIGGSSILGGFLGGDTESQF